MQEQNGERKVSAAPGEAFPAIRPFDAIDAIDKVDQVGLAPRAFGESGDARFRGTLDFREVKTDPRRIDLQALGLKVAAFFRKNPDLRRERFGIGGLSLDDM